MPTARGFHPDDFPGATVGPPVRLPPLPPITSERQWQDCVVSYARSCGWRCAYFRPARVLRGGKEVYETPVGGDAKGFPDTILVRDRVIVAELKFGTGRVTKEQSQWLVAFAMAGVDAWVWRGPTDWPKVVGVLT
jgi:hypothetical protein